MLRARNIYLTCKHDVNRKKILLTEIHTKSSKKRLFRFSQFSSDNRDILLIRDISCAHTAEVWGFELTVDQAPTIVF